jgi:hypothetical protein
MMLIYDLPIMLISCRRCNLARSRQVAAGAVTPLPTIPFPEHDEARVRQSRCRCGPDPVQMRARLELELGPGADVGQ